MFRRMSAMIAVGMVAFTPQTSAQMGRLAGHVVDGAGLPLVGVKVTVEGGTVPVVTDVRGDFTLTGLQAGELKLQLSGRGFAPQQESVQIKGDEARITVELQQVSASVDVVADLREYHVLNSSIASRTDEPLIDIPQSVQVYPNQLIEDRSILEGNDLFRNVSGINFSTYSAMTFRGFTQREILYNGSRGNPFGSLEGDVGNSGFSVSQIRLTNIQRVEVLKGPSSSMYGSADAGGLVNYVTRQPTRDTSLETQFRAGSYSQKYGNVDFSRPLTKQVFSRGAFYMEDRDTFRANTGARNTDAVLNLLYAPNGKHTFVAEGEYIDQLLRGQRLRGVPVDSLGNFLTYTRWVANEPSDRIKLVGRVLQLRGDHNLPRNWNVNYVYRLVGYENSDKYHEPRTLTAATATGRLMRRQYRNYYRANDDWAFTISASKLLQTGIFTHNIVTGFEQYNQNQDFRFQTAAPVETGGTVPSLDLFRPVYGLADPSKYLLTAPSTYTAHTRRTGVFGQDDIALNRFFKLVVAGRLDRFHDTGFADVALEYRDVALAGRAGLVFKPRPNFSVYAMGANSFNRAPIYAQAPAANGPFGPETGHQVEVGAKTDLLDHKLSLTTALFRIDKQNILRTDPAMGPSGNNPNAVLATGRARSEGIELNAEGFLGSRLYTTVNYAYLNTRILSDNTASAVGQRLANAPHHTVGLFARYNFLQHTGASFGLEGVTNRQEPYAGLRTYGYAIADVGLYQDFGSRVRAQLQGTNIANTTYQTASLFAARAGNVPGQPRAIVFTITVNPLRR